jgi:uncharacterized DUF497 family protein
MQFEWDQRKADANLRKHGVAFTDAIAVFSDPLARIFPDPDHSEDEQRELIVGYDGIARLFFVSFVERKSNIRIISARPATTTETRAHEKYLK